MHVTCILLLLCGLRSAVVGQELDLSHLAVLYADATYCDPAKLRQWRCKPCSLLHASNVEVHENQDAGSLMMTAFDEDRQVAVLAFRGAVVIQNWNDDYDWNTTKWWTPGVVHRGMLREYSSIREQVLATTQRWLNAMVKEVLVTGHSSGGNLAGLGALDCARTGLLTRKITFGEFRYGNRAFQRFAAKKLASQLRIIHRYDLVPRVCNSMSFLNFPCDLWVHSKNELWEVNSSFHMCDRWEDPQCHNGVPEDLLSWDDHNTYLGHAMWCCAKSSDCENPWPSLAWLRPTIIPNGGVAKAEL
eukprot:symbB.v1.2.036798.t1/scaffold5269.1/size29147/2